MDHAEKLLQCLAHPAAVRFLLLVRKRDEELHVADQVGHAELHQGAELAHVFAIGTEVVAAQNAVEFLAKHLDEHLRAARLVDLEQRVKLCAKAPRPEAVASDSLTLAISLASCPRQIVTPTASRRNLRIVENEA